MSLTTKDLITELATIIDSSLATAVVESYVQLQQRFLAGDWKPAELDGGRLCEATARALYQLDSGNVVHTPNSPASCPRKSKTPTTSAPTSSLKPTASTSAGSLGWCTSFAPPAAPSTSHPCTRRTTWTACSSCTRASGSSQNSSASHGRPTAKSSPTRFPNSCNSSTLIHELDGNPLVLQPGIPAREEILLLVGHASNNRLSRTALREHAHQKTGTVNAAITKMLAAKELRTTDDGDLALTPNGQRALMQDVIPKYTPK